MSDLARMARDLAPLILKTNGARVYNDANITHNTTGTWQTLTFNSERWDDAGYHDTVTNTSRFTIPQPGRYRIGGHVRFDANATGIRGIRITENAGSILGQVTVPTITDGNQLVLSVMTEMELSAGDYVELDAFQNSGGALTLVLSSGGNLQNLEFWISRI
jgi:hypothetical protein